METERTAGKQRGRPFQKGQSGNPGGRPKQAVEVRTLARRHTASALAALIEIAMQGSSESARVAAANALLDRGWGKPGSASAEPILLTEFQFAIGPPLGSAGFAAEGASEAPPPPEDEQGG